MRSSPDLGCVDAGEIVEAFVDTEEDRCPERTALTPDWPATWTQSARLLWGSRAVLFYGPGGAKNSGECCKVLPQRLTHRVKGQEGGSVWRT